MTANQAKRHHYLPQFYMRRFASADDENKVMVLERHRDLVVADRKSIDSIGYEESLHDYIDNGVPESIETDINKTIETPFSMSRTWLKITHADCASLDETDRLPLYGFARHLQLRNRSMLRFIQSQQKRFLAGELDNELTQSEREMHTELMVDSNAAHKLFRAGAMETMLPADATTISVLVCRTQTELRASTNPTLVFSHPGENSTYGAMFSSLRTWWLTLDRYWGVMIVAGGPAGFGALPATADLARSVNRRHLAQLLEGDARYLLVDDAYVREDLEWAGFVFERNTTRGFRYRLPSASKP